MNDRLSRTYDSLLIIRFQAGDDEALEELISRYQSVVRHSVIKRIGGNSSVADDISQEVWIQVIRSLSKLQQPLTFQAWLQRIVQRQVAVFLRKKERPLVPIEAVIDSIVDAGRPPDVGINVSDLLETLPEQFQSVIRLRYWTSMSYKAIAESLAIPVGTVRSRLHEARRKLTRHVQTKENTRE